MRSDVSPQNVADFRRFSRFFTRRIGVLDERLLGSVLTLTEGRILFEVASRGSVTATDLLGVVSIDRGYLSRILKSFVERGLIVRTPSLRDARLMQLKLTKKGQVVFEGLDAASQREVTDLLRSLSTKDQSEVIEAMQLIERRLSTVARSLMPEMVSLRPLQPGDIGWVVHRHGVLYAREYGWDGTFEALVAKIAAQFVEHFDPEREAAWIAELDGRIVGSAFVVSQSRRVAKLRLVYVEPEARGRGVGHQLVEEALRFASSRDYHRMTLWTNDVLVAARRLYERFGFVLTLSEATHNFGKDLVSETWEKELMAQ
ncbi:MAG: helix-turn-helix domain-containing GNAT family N-acetyltransferase [Hyphomicrobiaceae bacterium]|nr:MarR family transcriptional regulator [Hyphomicrobiaceae bacterium]